MLFKQRFLAGLQSGAITLAFRKWTQPSVRPGGTLKTFIGVLAIESLDLIRESEITATDARRAGYVSRGDLIAELRQLSKGALYRIELRYLGADPRIALREETKPSAAELREIHRRLQHIDAASRPGPWTGAVLRLLAKKSGVCAGDLALMMRQETAVFKINVRQLKNLGLTESLRTGYRLSPRGRVVLASLKEFPL
ncbi:MAG: hypothetical protein WCH75_23645 [Candidatus Binatia bacterium]